MIPPMKTNRTILPLACLFLTFTGMDASKAKTVTVDGTNVKTITEAMSQLYREDGDADIINVTAPVVVEPGQVTLTGKDPISINLDAGGKPSVIVFPKSVEKGGFLLKPPFLETSCAYTIQGGTLIPQFEKGIGENGKAAVAIQFVDGTSGFSANLRNLTVTASGEGNAPVAATNPFAKENTHWTDGIDLSRQSLNNLRDVSVNLSNSTIAHLKGSSFDFKYASANLGGLKINVTDSKLIRNNQDNARPMATWATTGVVVNMTRTELSDFKVLLMESMVGIRGFEWNINEGCFIHDFRSQLFLLWPQDNHQTISVNINGTAANPVRIENNKEYCFDLGSGKKWPGRRVGFSLKATHAKFSGNAGVLRTDWIPTRIPAAIDVSFTACDFTDNGTQPFVFKQGLLNASFAQCAFKPDLSIAGLDVTAASSQQGTGLMQVKDSVISAAPAATNAPSGNTQASAVELSKGPTTELVSRSAENQVFQFMTTQSYTPDEAVYKPQVTTGYLWIPPSCTKVRGLLVFGYNVPENWMVGHPALRKVCAEQNLAILYTNGSFRLAAVCHDGKRTLAEKGKAHVEFLQKIIDALAVESGHPELSTAAWLPMGESMSLMIVTHVTNGAPDRCIAGIHIKDGCWGEITSTNVPLLEACGTAAEWQHPDYDHFNRWRDMAVDDLENHIVKRTDVPGWPGSLLIEAGSAHFSVTERMCRYFADYIREAAKARLSTDGSPTLRAVDLNSGYVARLSIPGNTLMPPKPYSECTPEEKNLPWYFTKELAQEAYDMANVNWNAKSPDPVFADSQGNPIPFNAAGIIDLTFKPEKDGVTFTLDSTFLDKVPVTSLCGGTPLGHPQSEGGKPFIDWVSGPFVSLGGNRFRLAPDRTLIKNERTIGGTFRVIHPGDSEYRLSVNPGIVHISKNKAGKPQKITFEAIADQPSTTKEVALHAISDSGLPIQYYVQAGPAVIQGDKLVITDVPIGTKIPIPITVVANQFGNSEVQTAAPITQVFKLLPPAR